MSESPTQHRHIAPGPSPHFGEATGDSPIEENRRGSIDSTKKRVSMACLACKKSKRKCSGEPPCDNCRAFGRQCVFDETLDQRRRVAAKRTADELSYHRDMLNDLLKVMRAEDQSYALRLLEIIRRDATSEEIRAYIDDTLSHIEGKDKESEPAVRKLEDVRHVIDVEGAGPSFRPKVMDIHYLCDEVPYRVPAEPWTTVTRDADLVSHLISLYFTWDYPFHVFLDRDVFLKHMARGDTMSEFCSSFLVNALLANACHFSDYSEAYVDPGDIVTKGSDFLAEAERLRDEEPARLTLSYLQGTLLLYEKYSLAGKNDLGYKMLHQAIWTGESMGLIGSKRLDLAPGQVCEDLDVSLKRTAWGLFHIDTVVHTDFLRPSLIHKVNLERPNKHRSDQMTLWTPYPTHRDPRPSHLSQYFDESCNLCEIARDMSQRLFAIDQVAPSPEDRNKAKDTIYERLRHWYVGLPASFDTARRPPPYIILMRMRYHTLVINLFLYKTEDELHSVEPEDMKTPESTKSVSPLSKYNAGDITQSAARAIAALTRLHQREYGMSRAHHFAIYAINLALFVMLEQDGTFDILDSDFLSLASAFSNIASRSHLGRNLFHLFRQNVRAKCQGSRIHESHAVTDELKALFDERSTSPSLFDEYAKGLEKLDEDERYRVFAGDHHLSDMLDRYESLSLGKDDLAPRRRSEHDHDLISNKSGVAHESSPRRRYFTFIAQFMTSSNASNLGSIQRQPSQFSSPSDWVWRGGSMSSNSVSPMNYQLYPYTQFPDPNASQQTPLPPQQDRMPAAPKIAIPRATTAKASSQRRRSARACEPCRQRKVKCDGGRPECRKCREHGLGCSYIDIKRIRDQKQLGILSRKVERYEKLLRQLETEAEPTTSRKIKKALAADEQLPSDGEGEDDDGSDRDSNTSHDSLNEIDLVKEDLNRSEKAVAIGFFGKNSEVAWMQKLEDVSDRHAHQAGADGEKPPSREIPIMSMSYHLDDLNIRFSDTADPFAVPPKELADRYIEAYMESVHPSFAVIRLNTFTVQYEQFFNKKPSTVPPKWLAVLNMIFAIGCRYCKLTGRLGAGDHDAEELEYLNRARKLCLSGNVLFDHDDLQQIQVEVLVAFYLVALGQVNRASKFSSMALRSAISLGINLRFKDDRTPYPSKEARSRLWWSIFLLEHLQTSITGRISGCGESLSAASLPVPFEEGGEDENPEPCDILRDQSLQAKRLQLTIFQTEEESEASAAWLAKCKPSPTLLFHCIVDLQIITQAVINNVYSLQGLRSATGELERRLQKHSRNIDTWLHKVPRPYRFVVSLEDDRFHIPHKADHMRERITLAIYYYAARITLCRPCVCHTPCSLEKASYQKSRSSFRALMKLICFRASCSLLSILPDQPDTAWLTSVTPWWAILHFLMQATTALLIGIFTCSASDTNVDAGSKLPSLNREEMIKQTKKAFRWLHHLAFTSKAAHRAFLLCDSFLCRISPSLELDISDLPMAESLPPQNEDFDMTGDGLAMVDEGP